MGTANFRTLAIALLFVSSSGCFGFGSDTEDGDGSSGSGLPHGIGGDACAAPEPCGQANLSSESVELSPRDAAECFYQTIEHKEAAHLSVLFPGVVEDHFDLYLSFTEPSVLVDFTCEIDGPCEDPRYRRCELHALEYLNCAPDGESPRVCGAPSEWCQTMHDVEPVCP